MLSAKKAIASVAAVAALAAMPTATAFAAGDATQPETATSSTTAQSNVELLTNLKIGDYTIDTNQAKHGGVTITVDDLDAAYNAASAITYGTRSKYTEVKPADITRDADSVHVHIFAKEGGITANYNVTFKLAKKSSSTEVTSLTIDSKYVVDLAKAKTVEGQTFEVADPFAVFGGTFAGKWDGKMNYAQTASDADSVSYTYWVTAEDGVTQGPSYKVTFIRKAPIPGYTSLTLGGYTVDMTQAASAAGVTVSVPFDQWDNLNPLDIGGGHDANVQVMHGSNIGLVSDKVTGKVISSYYLVKDGEPVPGVNIKATFVREKNSDTTLSQLIIDGKYYVDLNKAKTVEGQTFEVADPAAVKGKDVAGASAFGSTVVADKTAWDDNSVSWTYYVVAEDGTRGTDSYKVTFKKESKPLSNKTDVAKFSVDGKVVYDRTTGKTAAATKKGVTIEVADPAAINPDNVKVIEGDKGVQVIKGSAVWTDKNDAVTYTYYVVAEDGTMGKTQYKVTFKHIKSSETGLTFLSVGGYEVNVKDAATQDGYTVLVKDPSKVDPKVIGAAMAKGAKLEYGGMTTLEDGVSYFYYVVAEDGTRSVTYRVNFREAPKSDATGLSKLVIDNHVVYDAKKGITDATSPEGHTVKVKDPSKVNASAIDGKWDEGATPKLGATATDPSGDVVSYTYYVVAEDGVTVSPTTYKVNFEREKCSGTDLYKLTVNDYDIDLAKAQTTDGDVIEVPADKFHSIDPKDYTYQASTNAKVLLGGTETAKDDSYVAYTYYVVAEDGTRGNSYKVTFKKTADALSHKTDVAKITVDGYVIYDRQVGNTAAATADGVTIKVADPTAIDPSKVEALGDPGIRVIMGSKVWDNDSSAVTYSYYVVAEDGTTISPTQYTVTFAKAESGETPVKPEQKPDQTKPADDQKTDTKKPAAEKKTTKKAVLSKTGAAVAGVGVFALIAAAGAAVLFTIRKRA